MFFLSCSRKNRVLFPINCLTIYSFRKKLEGAYKRAHNVWQEQGPHKGALLRLDFLTWYRYYNFINLQWQLQDMQMQLQGLYRCLVRYKWSALNIFLGIHILETEAEKANFFLVLDPIFSSMKMFRSAMKTLLQLLFLWVSSLR